jgi:hypothetical protein
MIRFLFAAMLAAFPSLDAYLGKPLDDVVKDLGECQHSWEEGSRLTNYTFIKDGLVLSIASVDGKIEKVKYQWKTPVDEEEIMDVIQEGNHRWKEVEGVSGLEIRDVAGYEAVEVFKKFVRADHEATAYYYHAGSLSYPYGLLIFTEAYRRTEAESIPRRLEFPDPRDKEHYQEKR